MLTSSLHEISSPRRRRESSTEFQRWEWIEIKDESIEQEASSDEREALFDDFLRFEKPDVIKAADDRPVSSAAKWVQFQNFREQWIKERGISSSLSKIVNCPSYRRIIGMGPAVVPLIMRQLENEGDKPTFWSTALQDITGARPFAGEDRGNVKRLAKAWLSWWRENRDAWELAAERSAEPHKR